MGSGSDPGGANTVPLPTTIQIKKNPIQTCFVNLYTIDTKIEYKILDFFYSDPSPDLRPNLEAF
jgi:hypothetical protein